jgi:hypothetical protein
VHFHGLIRVPLLKKVSRQLTRTKVNLFYGERSQGFPVLGGAGSSEKLASDFTAGEVQGKS